MSEAEYLKPVLAGLLFQGDCTDVQKGSAVNARERFLAIMNFERPDRSLLWEFGYWAGTIRRWYNEGLPKRAGIPSREKLPDGRGVYYNGLMGYVGDPIDQDVKAYFGMDEGARRVPVNYYLCPPFEEQVLEDHGDWYLWVDADGVTKHELKDRSTIPTVLDWPVSNRDDFERLRTERLRPDLEDRLPENWAELVGEFNTRRYPLLLGGVQGFYGTLRRLMGPEKLLYMFYDNPDLLKEINSYLVDFWIQIYDHVLDEIEVDGALVWEDMCYKAGPLISPAMFREFMLPHYQKLTSFLRDCGVTTVLVDTDGNCGQLLPLFIEGGVTGVYPFEVAAGMDIVEVRKAFPDLQIIGGLDKRKVAVGRSQIDAELEAKVPFMTQRGGYISAVDHTTPPDVSWDNFVYYRSRLKEMMLAAG